MQEEMGAEAFHAFLKKRTEARSLQQGQQQAEQFGNNSLAAFVDQFRPPRYKNLIVHEIVKDTTTIFEMKVTECIWAKTFLDAGAGDIGYAHVCYGDYAWTRGFNPNHKMVRNKTLMQGHCCCNHRYVVDA